VGSEPADPSPFLLQYRAHLREAARLGPILDLACGRGRHSLACVDLGLATVSIDRNPESLDQLRAATRARSQPLRAVRSDLEAGLGIPFRAETFGAILVFRFLFRPLAPALQAALRPGGLLLYETFTERQRALGLKPSNPAFLLAEGELAGLFPGLEVLEYRELVTNDEWPEAVARLAALRPG
jgi:SAM-dependent methyltransferase